MFQKNRESITIISDCILLVPLEIYPVPSCSFYSFPSYLSLLPFFFLVPGPPYSITLPTVSWKIHPIQVMYRIFSYRNTIYKVKFLLYCSHQHVCSSLQEVSELWEMEEGQGRPLLFQDFIDYSITVNLESFHRVTTDLVKIIRIDKQMISCF